MTHALLELFREAEVIPVVRARSVHTAATAVAWLRDAGIRIFEIALTVPEAPGLIRALARDPSLIVGAGAVPDAAAAEACLDAGAKFIVTPWVDASLSEPCRDAGALLILCAATPTEVRAALAAGADAVTVFPVSRADGPGHIEALAGVFPGVAFCPAGAINPDDFGGFLDAGAAFVRMGGALTDEKRILSGGKDAIQAAARLVLGQTLT
jgi:2-dehydro-3-deoxyphosphogluconate aldolase/(4S)-4-hydroxy-2-oxoglutarate aldolase